MHMLIDSPLPHCSDNGFRTWLRLAFFQNSTRKQHLVTVTLPDCWQSIQFVAATSSTNHSLAKAGMPKTSQDPLFSPLLRPCSAAFSEQSKSSMATRAMHHEAWSRENSQYKSAAVGIHFVWLHVRTAWNCTIQYQCIHACMHGLDPVHDGCFLNSCHMTRDST